MNTAPLQNPATLLSAPPPAGAKPAAADTPFNQLLSREVAQRASNEAPASEAANRPADASAERPAGEADATDTAEAVTVTSASAELLALVAGLQRGADQPEAQADGAEADALEAVNARLAALVDGRRGAAQTGLAAAESGQGRAAVAADDKALPPLLADSGADAGATAEPAAAGKGGAFATALKQAADAPAADAHALRAPEAAAPTAAAAPVAPAALQAAAHNAASVAGDKLTPQVGTPAWDSALGQKVVWMVAGGQQSAALTLNPPDLGPLQVVLHVNNSQAHATFVSAQPEVRQALEAAMPRLREMLGDAGIQLGQANVGADMPGQQQAAAEQSARQSGRSTEPAVAGVETAVQLPRAAQATAGGRGLVDTFA